MAFPLNTITETVALHDADRKHPNTASFLLWFVSHSASWWRA
jgi:hypothetical protein